MKDFTGRVFIVEVYRARRSSSHLKARKKSAKKKARVYEYLKMSSASDDFFKYSIPHTIKFFSKIFLWNVGYSVFKKTAFLVRSKNLKKVFFVSPLVIPTLYRFS